MREYIEDRVYKIAEYIIETGATVRGAADIFKVSKSTVHKDVTQRLEQLDLSLAHAVKEVLELNKAERHIRGGQATYRKYKHIEQ